MISKNIADKLRNKLRLWLLIANKLRDNATKNRIAKWIEDRYFLIGNIEGALFISKENKRMCGNSISKLVDKYSQAALGYHISPHKLRSGFISILYEEKHDVEYVRRVVGHSNVTTTQRYIVTNNDERKEAVDILGSLLNE